MAKFYNLSIFATLFLFTFATSFEIAPIPNHKIPTSPKNALENSLSPQSIPKVEIVYPLSKPKVSPKPSPNKPLPSHLAPKSSTTTTRQSQSSSGRLAPKSSIKQNLSPKPIEKHTSNVFSSKPIPHSTTKVTKLSPFISRPTQRKYLPIHLTPRIPKNKQNLSPKSSPKPIRNHLPKLLLVRPKVGSHVAPKSTRTRKFYPNTHLAPKSSPKPTRNHLPKLMLVRPKVGSHVAPKSTRTRKFSPNTHLAPKSSVTKPNILLNPTGKIITKTRLAPKEAPKSTHKAYI